MSKVFQAKTERLAKERRLRSNNYKAFSLAGELRRAITEPPLPLERITEVLFSVYGQSEIRHIVKLLSEGLEYKYGERNNN